MKYFNLCLHKAYFEKGYSLINYVKYMIALFGLSSLNVKVTMFLGVAFAILCYVIGFVWYKLRIIDAELEVSNQFNPFCTDIRQKFDIPNK